MTRFFLKPLVLFIVAFPFACSFGQEEDAPFPSTISISNTTRSASETPCINDNFVINGKNYTLDLYDEFDDDTLNRDYWNKAIEQYRCNGKSYWKKDNVSLEKGNLVIKCEEGKVSESSTETTMLVGAIESTNLKNYNKGVFEIRFMVSKNIPGTWHAFWLYTQAMNYNAIPNSAKDGAEIDMFENPPNLFETTVHYDGYGDDIKRKYTGKRISNSFYGQYHTFHFIWDDAGYSAYLDGKLINYIKIEEAGGACEQNMRVVISTESRQKNSLETPVYFYTDYVKVYKE